MIQVIGRRCSSHILRDRKLTSHNPRYIWKCNLFRVDCMLNINCIITGLHSERVSFQFREPKVQPCSNFEFKFKTDLLRFMRHVIHSQYIDLKIDLSQFLTTFYGFSKSRTNYLVLRILL